MRTALSLIAVSLGVSLLLLSPAAATRVTLIF